MRLLTLLLLSLSVLSAESLRSQLNRIAATLALGQFYGEVSAADAGARLTRQASGPSDPAAWSAALLRLTDRLLNDASLAAQNTPNAFDRETRQRRLTWIAGALRAARDTDGDLFEPLVELAALAGRPNAQLFAVYRAEARRLLQTELSRSIAAPQATTQPDPTFLAGDWTGYFTNNPNAFYPERIAVIGGRLVLYAARQPNNPNDIAQSSAVLVTPASLRQPNSACRALFPRTKTALIGPTARSGSARPRAPPIVSRVRRSTASRSTSA